MSIAQTLTPELEQEMKSTRAHLERLPEDKYDWKPHDKSMAAGRLASHITELLDWVTMTVKTDSLDLAPPDGPKYESANHGNQADLLAHFDKSLGEAKDALAGASDEELMKDWTLLSADTTYFTMPKVACIRSFCLNHVYHHRAQLGVYLRLLDVPVPSTYGPSADEGG